jgi:hypothetical protein
MFSSGLKTETNSFVSDITKAYSEHKNRQYALRQLENLKKTLKEKQSGGLSLYSKKEIVSSIKIVEGGEKYVKGVFLK